MEPGDPVVQAERQQALKRTAQRKMIDLDGLRAAKLLFDLDCSQREIAEILLTNQTKVHRMLKFVELKGGDIPIEPEELILRTAASEISRQEMLERLKAFEYSVGTDAPSHTRGMSTGHGIR